MKRYSPTVGEAMHEDEDGEWVRYEDAKAELEDAIAEQMEIVERHEE